MSSLNEYTLHFQASVWFQILFFYFILQIYPFHVAFKFHPYKLYDKNGVKNWRHLFVFKVDSTFPDLKFDNSMDLQSDIARRHKHWTKRFIHESSSVRSEHTKEAYIGKISKKRSKRWKCYITNTYNNNHPYNKRKSFTCIAFRV